MKPPRGVEELREYWAACDAVAWTSEAVPVAEQRRMERKIVRRNKWRAFWWGFAHPFGPLR